MKVIVNNLAVEYRDSGAGPGLLFLHGWKDSLHTFDALVKFLPEGYRIVALDLPGFGQTEIPGGAQAWSVSDYAEFVKAFAKKIDLNIFCAVGHSFGCRVIIKGMCSGILNPEKTVLIGAAGISKINSARSIAFKIAAKLGKAVLALPPLSLLKENARKKLYKKAGSDYLSAGSLKNTYLSAIAEDLSACAQKISQPALLIWGEKDSETPLSDGKIFEKLIAKSRLAVFADCGHFVHKEEPAAVAREIAGFLSNEK